jgi:plasmid stabilization system protein ParE
VAAFRVSRLAETDLLEIAEYTLRTWGAEQTFVTWKESKLVAECSRIIPSSEG